MNYSFYIFPFNGNSMEIIDSLNTDNCIGIIDDFSHVEKYLNHDIIKREDAVIGDETKILFAYGGIKSINKRKKVLESLDINNSQLLSFIDKTCTIGKLVKIGAGSFIMAGCRITSNAKIGKCVGILHNSVIHHDCKIGDFSLIGSNVTLAGGVSIGENCYIGSGALIKPGIKVQKNSIIGMGAVVTKNIEKGKTVYGVPAK